jgi:nitrous oxidase accessory protein
MKRKWLAVGIILLFLGTCLIPAIAHDIKKPFPTLGGKWLYVGGSGPGNYTWIQDAINDASDGDTVFVYDDSSPYFEALQITRSISLIGEEKHTTIIDVRTIKNTSALNISADGVLVQGFTIQNSTSSDDIHGVPSFDAGIEIIADNVLIKENIIKDNEYGMVVGGFLLHYPDYMTNHCSIDGNNIYENNVGIMLIMGDYSTISHNRISFNRLGIELNSYDNSNISTNEITENNETGIQFFGGTNNSIFQNTITGNHNGVVLQDSEKALIIQNNITENYCGVFLLNSDKNSIQQNNIYKNKIQSIWCSIGPFVDFLAMKRRPLDNTWDGNYWGRANQVPKPIFGFLWFLIAQLILKLCLHPLKLLEFLLTGGTGFLFFIPSGLPIIKFDWHPAQEPYDIPGMT